MTTKKFKYNEATNTYEPIKNGWLRVVRNVGAFLVLASVFGVATSFFFKPEEKPSRENELAAELKEMQTQYKLLKEKVKQSEEVLTQIEERDNNLYRSYFSLNPISEDVRKAGFGGTNRYAKYQNMKYGDLVSDVAKNIDILNKQMVIQSKSLDEVVAQAKKNEKKLAHLPAISPVPNKSLKRIASGYGSRFHPILRVMKEHKGLDFAANVGTPIYATADGKVKTAGAMGGYGNTVVVNHGYGYETLYAHMSRIKARNGQSVKRGDIIGYVGSTGLSTGPHLHYEVHKDGQAVDPSSYFYQDISPEEFKALLEKSQQMSVSLD